MLIPKELEAKIETAVTNALSAASVTGVSVRGSWDVADAGLVKWVESDETSPAFVKVSVGTAEHQTFTTPTCSFAANVTAFLRYELDPTGSLLASIAEALEALFRSWQSSTYQQAFTALDIEGVLSIDDLSIGGGNSPSLSNGLVSVTWPLTLTGNYLA